MIRKKNVLLITVALSTFLCGSSTFAVPIVVGIMEGYNGPDLLGVPWEENTLDIDQFNTRVRDNMRGKNYFSRVFEWDQVDAATNYFNLFENSTNYLIGYSRGGYQALRVANELNQGDVTIDRLIQLDPVRCGGNGLYGADSASSCLNWDGLRPYIGTDGTQKVPPNVTSATNYFQTGGGIRGERNVEGATNINVNVTYANQGGAGVNHSTIDAFDPLLRDIADDIASLADNNVLMSGLGGPAGYGTLAMTRNDDGSTSAIQLPFEVNFNGTAYNTLFINTNGNITFGQPYGAYTPTGFDNLSVEMIAPFWGDVDTRCPDCGEVYLSVPTADVAVITWDNVGFYSSNASKTNTFQMILRDRNDLEGGNTDIEFRYGDLQWTTGDASGGSNGLGGQPAFAGYTGGINGSPQTITGSGTHDILTLNQRTNIEGGIPGTWYFTFRDGGSAPGTTIDNPLLPDVQEDGWHFQYTTTQIDQMIWSDPELVYGYDFLSMTGINFRSFILPVLGDNAYELWLGSASNPTYIADIIGGTEYFFDALGLFDGVDFFRILGVDLDLLIDPNNTTAFVTGLSFMQPGVQQWIQTPLSVNTDNNVSVDEPPVILLLLAAGLPLLGLRWRINHA